VISNKGILFTILIPGLLVAACAVSPEAEERRRAMEEEIGFILAEPLDVEQFGETRRCLRDVDFRNFRVLDDKRILFEGRRGRLWLNTLRTRCPDLRYGSILIVRPTLTMGRMCDMDTFRVGDWFDWPWYRRWPWQWGWGWGASGNCVLGEFQPVTESQVNLIEEAISKK
jgi:hypothetical protein